MIIRISEEGDEGENKEEGSTYLTSGRKAPRWRPIDILSVLIKYTVNFKNDKDQ